MPVYPVMSERSDLIMTGSVRIDLPKYRVRGSCSITRFAGGMVVIDFIHSSLFGSYREEATIYVEEGRMTIHDLRRGEVWQNEEALSMLGDNLGIGVFADDILHLLLLDVLPGEEDELAYERHGDGYRAEGVWLGRGLSVSLDDSGRRESMRLCDEDKTPCYEIKYGYNGRELLPEKIVISNSAGPERLSLVITGISEESLTKD